MTKIKKIKYIGIEKQQCITTSSKDGLYITDDHIVTHNSKLFFVNNIGYKLQASANALLGLNIVFGSMTELSFFSDAGWAPEKIFKFFTSLRERINNRLKGNYYGRFILDSSPSNLEDVIQAWITNEAPKNKENMVVTGSRWQIFPQEFPDFSKIKLDAEGRVTDLKEQHDFKNGFPMFKGGGGKLASIIQTEEQLKLYDPIDVFWCPRTQRTSNGTKSFYDAAMEDPIGFMQNQGGIPVGAADRIFYDPAVLDNVFNNNLKNLYGYITAPAEHEPEHLIFDQIKETFFYKVLDKYYFYYKPELPRVLSVDQSLSGDLTCISVSHTERDPVLVDTDTGDKLTLVVTDFTIVIAPKGGIINLDAIKFFIMDLTEIGHLNIRKVSFDQFQSASTQQFLKRKGIPVERLSVDSDNEVYNAFVVDVQHRRYYCGKNIFMINNMKSLYMRKTKTKTKFDHFSGDTSIDFSGNWEKDIKDSYAGRNAKDVSDAVAANIGLLSKYSNEFIPTTTWNPDTIFDRSYDAVKKANMEYVLKSGFLI
jgi:hypothetical protein